MSHQSGYNGYSGLDYAVARFFAAVGGVVSVVLVGVLLLLAVTTKVQARDFSDPSLTPQQQLERYQWFSRQKMPDNPGMSCCGEGDAYYADSVFRDGKDDYAVITDDRPDGPLGRPHIKPGTRIAIPPHKYKDTRADPNPTAHTIIFVRWYDEDPDYGNWGVLCYLPYGGM